MGTAATDDTATDDGGDVAAADDVADLSVGAAAKLPSSSTTLTGRLREQRDADMTRPETAIQNMAIMNARLKRKRATTASEDVREASENAPPRAAKSAAKTATMRAAPASKRTKRGEPQVINKTRLKENAAAATAAGRRSNRNRQSTVYED